MTTEFIKLISSFSARYQTEYLSDYKTDALVSDWWEAFDFFLSRACFQGRRDEVSLRVYKAAIETLAPFFEEKYQKTKFRRIKENNWETIKNCLEKKIGKGKVGKARDIEMIISALSFLDRLDDMNIVNYSVEQINDNKISDLYQRLQHSKSKDGIIQVGPKIASFFLRDLVFLFSLEDKITLEALPFIQPVDTWVRQVCHSIGVASEDDSDGEIRNKIISHCNNAQVDPLAFNQGIWYVGYHSYELVLELLKSQAEQAV